MNYSEIVAIDAGVRGGAPYLVSGMTVSAVQAGSVTVEAEADCCAKGSTARITGACKRNG